MTSLASAPKRGSHPPPTMLNMASCLSEELHLFQRKINTSSQLINLKIWCLLLSSLGVSLRKGNYIYIYRHADITKRRERLGWKICKNFEVFHISVILRFLGLYFLLIILLFSRWNKCNSSLSLILPRGGGGGYG